MQLLDQAASCNLDSDLDEASLDLNWDEENNENLVSSGKKVRAPGHFSDTRFERKKKELIVDISELNKNSYLFFEE